MGIVCCKGDDIRNWCFGHGPASKRMQARNSRVGYVEMNEAQTSKDDVTKSEKRRASMDWAVLESTLSRKEEVFKSDSNEADVTPSDDGGSTRRRRVSIANECATERYEFDSESIPDIKPIDREVKPQKGILKTDTSPS